MSIKKKAHCIYRNSLLIVFAGCFFAIINYYYIGVQTNMPLDHDSNHYLPFHPVYTKASLLALFTETATEHVRANNWLMGCADLHTMLPYFRAISDRGLNLTGNHRLIIDVGANFGDDTESAVGAFHNIAGMCNNMDKPFTLVSIEPSPQVFCELTKYGQKRGWNSPAQNVHLLNIAVSDRTGSLRFSDPGNEGGKLLDQSSSEMPPMTKEDIGQLSRCRLKNLTDSIDGDRVSIVPTYTIDILVASLKNLNIVETEAEVFILKTDAEGHDEFVLKGSTNLLREKRITFVVFEVFDNNALLRIVEHMSSLEYTCFLISPKMLIPVHPKEWWYQPLDGPGDWWGNGICGISGSASLSMLWHMFHSDNLILANSYFHLLRSV